MRRGAFSALLAGAFVVALVVAGCGGGGEADPEPLSKTAFIEKGNAICRQATKEQEQALRAASNGTAGEFSSADEELQGFVENGALPSLQKMTEELGDLGAPKKDEEQVDAIVASFEDATEKMESDPHSALPGEVSTEANELAASYGLMDCGI